jgi:hypothetical protein
MYILGKFVAQIRRLSMAARCEHEETGEGEVVKCPGNALLSAPSCQRLPVNTTLKENSSMTPLALPSPFPYGSALIAATAAAAVLPMGGEYCNHS